MPKVVPGALLAELRSLFAISVVSVTLTVNAASYRCRMPSASATVIVANDRRYLYRIVADRDSSLESTSPFAIAISGFSDGSYQFLLHTTCLPSNKSKFKLFLARSLICPSQSNLEFAGYIAVALGHNVSTIVA